MADQEAWAGWVHDQQLIDIYTRRITEAFHNALRQAADVIRAWWSGSLTMTRLSVVNSVSEIIKDELAKVLHSLWEEAWYLGSRSAGIAISHDRADFHGWSPGHNATAMVANEGGLRHLLNAYGPSALDGMARTRMVQLGDALTDAVRAGASAESITAQLEKILNVKARAPMIASTEIQRSIAIAAMDKYRQAGVPTKQWLTPPEGSCPICKENEAQGAIALSKPFMSGALCSPQHPNCRCVQVPGEKKPSRQSAVTVSRASLPGHVLAMIQEDLAKGLNPEEVVTIALASVPRKRVRVPDASEWGGGSGMGAPSMPSHAPPNVPRSTSDQRPGTSAPLPSAGGEPPRAVLDGSDEEQTEGSIREVDLDGQIRYRPVPDREGRYPYIRNGIPGGIPAGETSQAPDGDPFTLPRPANQSMPAGNDGGWPTHRGRPPNYAGKNDLGIDSAGLVVKSRKTGRVLMVQRSIEKLYKDAADLSDPNSVEAEHVMNQMRKNYPENSIQWMKKATWIGPVLIPHDRIDYAGKDGWAASHQPKTVARFAQEIREGCGHCHPVVMVQKPGEMKVQVIDGHHRTLAYRKLGQKVKAYVGRVSADKGPWDETHSFQIHQGASPMNKSDDDKFGKWEFPSGHLEPGETPLQAACREWEEETGLPLPKGKLKKKTWMSPDGAYRGYVLKVKSEKKVPFSTHQDGHNHEAVAWWDLESIKDNPAVRAEILQDIEIILDTIGC
jgi:SPP1 gp7 family putative phage head morphogenesis protein